MIVLDAASKDANAARRASRADRGQPRLARPLDIELLHAQSETDKRLTPSRPRENDAFSC